MSTEARTDEEILARIEAVKEDDFWGYRKQLLVGYLSYEAAKPFLTDEFNVKPDAQATWDNDQEQLSPAEAAQTYLSFAIGKALDHRGLSAVRSVDKLTEYAWLLGRDDIVAAMDAAPYPQYGVPKLFAFGDGMGWQHLLVDPGNGGDSHEMLARMSQGKHCYEGCTGGCGL